MGTGGMGTPKSQIKLTQIINNTGAVAAVPYYTRKALNNGPSEISSQQALPVSTSHDDMLKMQITNLRNVVHAKKQI